MRFRYREFERVIVRVRRATHASGEVFGPRLIWGRIKGVGGRSDLQNYCVQMKRRSSIEHLQQLLLLLPGG
jgi:hypothetical protein